MVAKELIGSGSAEGGDFSQRKVGMIQTCILYGLDSNLKLRIRSGKAPGSY